MGKKEMWSGQDCAPGRETQRKGEIIKSGDLPWKVNCSNHILGTPALGSDKEAQPTWLIEESVRLTGGVAEAQFLLMKEYTNVCLHLKQGGGATLKPQNWLIVVLFFFLLWPPWCMAQSEPSKYSAQFALCCCSMLEEGLAWLRKRESSTVRYCWDWNPRSE